MKDRNQIIAENPIITFMERRGSSFEKNGTEYFTICPLHDDHNPSLRVNDDKQAWKCDPCDLGGSVIDLVMHWDGLSAGDAMRVLSGEEPRGNAEPFGQKASAKKKPEAKPKAKKSKRGPVVESYDYCDAGGTVKYRVHRHEPKTFTQTHINVRGEEVAGLDGVERYPYRLHKFVNEPEVWITEGEKDVHTLERLGIVATCCNGGSNGWLEAYGQYFVDKEVVLCGDNDDPGRKYLAAVRASVEGKCKTLREVTIPECGDISEYCEKYGDDKAVDAVQEQFQKAEVLSRGVSLPIYSMEEMQEAYERLIRKSRNYAYDLGKWVPKLGKSLRPLVPGDLVTILAATGIGKTAMLQNIAKSAAPLPCLFFEIELPLSMTFERTVSIDNNVAAWEVEKAYQENRRMKFDGFNHVFTCPQGRMTVQTMGDLVEKAELKMGKRPVMVIVDYIQLLGGGSGSRYERMSSIAEDLKVFAKQHQVILFVASQIKRKDEGAQFGAVSLNDAKDSGSIENSSGVVLGIWKSDSKTMQIDVLKATRGGAGDNVVCDFNGPTLQIRQRSEIIT